MSALNGQINTLSTEVHDLNVQKNFLATGKEIKYIVKFKIKQSTFTLDIFEHAKNEMNSIEIEIPVNKDYYKKLLYRQEVLAQEVSRKISVHCTLITTFGLKRNEYSGVFTNVIVLDDLFVV